MADALFARAQTERHASARSKRRRDDLLIAVTAMAAAMIALPLAQNSWHGPEAAAVLAVAATAMLAGQRWAIAIVVIAELLLAPTVVLRAFMPDSELAIRIAALIAVAGLVPGVLAMRRAAAALVLVTGQRRTQVTCRRFQIGLVAMAAIVTLIPLL
jgi:hypothetical protein